MMIIQAQILQKRIDIKMKKILILLTLFSFGINAQNILLKQIKNAPAGAMVVYTRTTGVHVDTLLSLVAPTPSLTFQNVTDYGSTTTNSITTGGLLIKQFDEVNDLLRVDKPNGLITLGQRFIHNIGLDGNDAVWYHPNSDNNILRINGDDYRTLFNENNWGNWKEGHGTASPQYPYHFYSNTGTQNGYGSIPFAIEGYNSEIGLTLVNNDTGGRRYNIFSTSDASGVGGGKFVIGDETAGVDRLTVDNTGKVGIGTTNPTAKLDVIGNMRILSPLDAISGGLSNITHSLSITGGWRSSYYSDNGYGTELAFYTSGLKKALLYDNYGYSHFGSAYRFSIKDIATLKSKIFVDMSTGYTGIGDDYSVPNERLEISDGNLRINGLTANSLVYANGSKNLSSITLGSGLSLSSGTLSATSTASTTTITAGTNITVSGSSPNYTVSAPTAVTYTGAIQDVDLGNYNLNAKSLNVTGTAGNGHLHLKHQTVDASSTGSSTTIFADVNGNLKWKNDGLYYSTLNTSSQTADRVFRFQDKSYTLADSAIVATKQGSLTAGTNITISTNTISVSTSPSFTNPTLTGTTTLTGVINHSMSASAASSATVDLAAWTGNYGHITGTTTIVSFGTVQAGAKREITFDGSLTLTSNTVSLILPGNTNIQTAANDVGVFVSEGSGNWRCVSYMRNDESYTAYTPTWTGFSAAPTIASGEARYKMITKNTCHVIIYPSASGTSNANSLTVTLPFTAYNAGTFGLQAYCVPAINNGAFINGSCRTVGGSNVLNCYNGIIGGTWTTSGSKSLFLSIVYQID